MENLYEDFQFPKEEIRITTLENNKKEWKIIFEGNGKDHITEDDIISFFLLKNYIPKSISVNREIFLDKFYEWAWQYTSCTIFFIIKRFFTKVSFLKNLGLSVLIAGSLFILHQVYDNYNAESCSDVRANL